MTETETETTETTEQQSPPEGDRKEAPEPKGFDAEYVGKLRAEAAKYRTEARANADAAKRLAEYEDTQKSEGQKTADRIAAVERRAEAAEQSALRSGIAAEYGISKRRADLYLTGTDEETLIEQAKGLVEIDAERDTEAKAADAARKKQGNRVPREGTTTTATESDERETVRLLFGG